MNSHTKCVLAYMKEHGSITSLEAIKEFGCTRLSAIIFLLKRQGHPITTTIEKSKNRYEREVRYARYHLCK